MAPIIAFGFFLALISPPIVRAGPDYEATCLEFPHQRIVRVWNTRTFDAAVTKSQPGDLIIMSPGKYSPTISGSNHHAIGFSGKRGTATKPITLCGPRSAIIDGGSSSRGPVLFRIIDSTYIRVVGMTMKNGLKGINVENSYHSVIRSVYVTKVGGEGIHLQKFSSYNVIKDCLITYTGRKRAGIGEGIYIGSDDGARRNDRCIRNDVLNNKIGPGVTAEPIDIKQFTRDGVIQGNTLDGSDLCGCNYAVSLINVKGNGYKILDNIGKNAKQDMFKTSQTNRGEGRNNHFAGNSCLGKLRSGFDCVRIAASVDGNTVACGQKTNAARCRSAA